MPDAMDAAATGDGRIRDPIAVRLPDRPLAPWLRLAHVTRTPADRAPDRGHARTIRDCMLMLQIEGDSWMWSRDAGGAVAMPRGSIAFVPPGFVHAWGETAGAHVAVHFDLHAQPGLVPFAMLRPLGEVVAGEQVVPSPWFRLARADGRDPLLVPLVTPLRAPERWRQRFEPLIRQWGVRAHDGAAARARSAGILATAIADLADEAAALRAPLPSPGERRVADLLARIADDDEGDARRWSLPTLARAARLGETAFRAAFRRVAGTNPRAWLERRQIERAARWLLETGRPIARIGEDAGYPDPYHFSRVFRRVMGASPRAFRQRATAARG